MKIPFVKLPIPGSYILLIALCFITLPALSQSPVDSVKISEEGDHFVKEMWHAPFHEEEIQFKWMGNSYQGKLFKRVVQTFHSKDKSNWTLQYVDSLTKELIWTPPLPMRNFVTSPLEVITDKIYDEEGNLMYVDSIFLLLSSHLQIPRSMASNPQTVTKKLQKFMSSLSHSATQIKITDILHRDLTLVASIDKHFSNALLEQLLQVYYSPNYHRKRILIDFRTQQGGVFQLSFSVGSDE